MPKIKLKPNLIAVEVGIGNKVNLKVAAGETVEVTEELLKTLLSFGHFEEAEESEADSQKLESEIPEISSQNLEEAEKQEDVSRDPMEEKEQ